MMTKSKHYRRALLKISGEAMAGARGFGIDHIAASEIAGEIAIAHKAGHEIAVTIGGGNILRGSDAASVGVPPLIGDRMGMMATVLNAVALEWALKGQDVPAMVMSAFPVGVFVPVFEMEEARKRLSQGMVVIFAGGTGNPCFTTDSGAALRAVEIEADVLVKATQARGVYDKDPNKHLDAIFYETITPQEVIRKGLGVLDAASVEILARKKMPAIVCDLHVKGNILRSLSGNNPGTLIAWPEDILND